MERRRRNDCEICSSWRDSLVLQQWQFLSQLGDIFTLKIEQTAAPKDFSHWKKICFDLALAGRGGSLEKQYNTSWHIMQPPLLFPMLALTPTEHSFLSQQWHMCLSHLKKNPKIPQLIQSFFKLFYGLCVSWEEPTGFRMNSAWCIRFHICVLVSVERFKTYRN